MLFNRFDEDNFQRISELEDLVDILNRCEAVRTYALDELYSHKFQYVQESDSYTQDAYDDLYLAWQDVWLSFAGDWINRWQL